MPANRTFGIALAIGLSIMGCAPLLRHGRVRLWALALALTLVTIAWVRPRALEPIAQVWMKAAHLLNRLLTYLVMGLLFFLVVTPIGLVRRMWLRDPFRLRIDPDAPTYWITRHPPGPAPEAMANQF